MAASIIIMSIILSVFAFHVVLLGIEVVLSLLIPGLKYLADKTSDTNLNKEASRYMNYIAITYASQQVMLTATTVFTLAFFPEFLVLAGRILFYPLAFFILAFALRLSLMSAFWYGWERWPRNLYYGIGAAYAFLGIVVVYLDSVLLGFLNYPKGLYQANPLKVNNAQLYLNPTTYPLFFVLVFAAVAVTLSILVFIHATRIRVNSGPVDTQKILVRYYLLIAWVSAVLFIPSLLWYLASLARYSEYKYSNIVGGILTEAQGSSFSWLLVVFLLLLIAFGATLSVDVQRIWRKKQDTIEDIKKDRLLIYHGPLGAALFVALFLLNLLSQTPYLVSDPELASSVLVLNVRVSINPYADMLDLYSLTFFVLIPYFIAFATLLYFFFTGVIGGDREIKGKRLAGVIE